MAPQYHLYVRVDIAATVSIIDKKAPDPRLPSSSATKQRDVCKECPRLRRVIRLPTLIESYACISLLVNVVNS